MITTKRLLESLEWMVADMAHVFNAAGMGGGYSEELAEAIQLVKELKENGESAVLSQSTIGEMKLLAGALDAPSMAPYGGGAFTQIFAEDGIDLG